MGYGCLIPGPKIMMGLVVVLLIIVLTRMDQPETAPIIELTVVSFTPDYQYLHVEGVAQNATRVKIAGQSFTADPTTRFSFRLKVHVSYLTERTIRAIADNATFFTWMTAKQASVTAAIPFPPNRWERYTASGTLVGFSIDTPTPPIWGWFTDHWVYIKNNQRIEHLTMSTPIQIYALLGVSLVGGLFVWLQWIKRSVDTRRKQAASAAFMRLKHHLEWANPVQNSPLLKQPLEFSVVGRFLEDAALCAQVDPTPYMRKVHAYAHAMSQGMEQYATALMVLNTNHQSLAVAWDAVQELPLGIPHFAYLFRKVEQEWLKYCPALLDATPGEALVVPSPYILDALGVLMPNSEFLTDLAKYHQLRGKIGQSQTMLLTVNQLYERFILRASAAMKDQQRVWHPHWKELVTEHVNGLAAYGLDGFYTFLVAAVAFRSNVPTTIK